MKKFLFILILLFSVNFFYPIKIKAEEPYYDFYLEQISVSPPSPMVGQKCKISVIFKNKGTKIIYDADGFLRYEYNFEDFDIDTYTIPNPTIQSPIYPRDYFQYYFEGKFLNSGLKNLFFDFKFYDYYYEKDNTNNSKSKAISVGDESDMDLSVKNIEIDNYEDGIVAGDDVKVTITIKNTGQVSFIDGRGILGDNIELENKGFQISSYQFPGQPTIDNSFDPGEELEYIYYGEFNKLGDQKITFYVDYKNEVTESDENNNSLSLTKYIYRDADERDDFHIYEIYNNIISTSTVSIFWKTTKKSDSNVDYRVKYYTYDFSIERSNVNSEDHEIKIEDLSPGATYLYRVKSIKNNIRKQSDYYEFTMPAEDEISVLEGPNVNFVSENNPKITWQTDVISQSYVYYKLNTGYNFKKKGSNDLTDEHSVDLGTLNPGTYQYYVVSTSTVMNLAYISDISSFEIQEENDDGQEINIEPEPGEEPVALKTEYDISNVSLYNRLKGQIILKTEEHGEAYYVDPDNNTMYYLGRPDDAFNIMRELGLGVSEQDYNNFFSNNNTAPARLSGKIILRVESHGEAYYINPNDLKMYYLGRPADAFNVMRELGLGISNSDFDAL